MSAAWKCEAKQRALTWGAASHPEDRAEMVPKGGYPDQQIFNVDKTVLYQKKVPARTYVAGECKACPQDSKDSLTLLLGATVTLH